MKGINHLVLAGHDLEAMRSHYAGLGFTVTPRGQHPFGTGNSLVQLHGSYLELLAVTAPQDVPEHCAGHFSFAAFNRDYLARHQGFSMLVLDTPDARADIKAWGAAGLHTYEPLDFSRTAKMANGEEITVAFSLAFFSHPAAPWLGLFACQHYSPRYFEQPRYLQHRQWRDGCAGRLDRRRNCARSCWLHADRHRRQARQGRFIRHDLADANRRHRAGSPAGV